MDKITTDARTHYHFHQHRRHHWRVLDNIRGALYYALLIAGVSLYIYVHHGHVELSFWHACWMGFGYVFFLAWALNKIFGEPKEKEDAHAELMQKYWGISELLLTGVTSSPELQMKLLKLAQKAMLLEDVPNEKAWERAQADVLREDMENGGYPDNHVDLLDMGDEQLKTEDSNEGN